MKEHKKEKIDKETAASIIKEAIKYSPYEYFSRTFLCEEGTLFNYEGGGKEEFSNLIYNLKEVFKEVWEERRETNIFEELREQQQRSDDLAETGDEYMIMRL